MAKRYNIVVPKKYNKDGEEKTAWKNVGTLVRFPPTEDKDEGYIMELNMYPDVTFKIFEEKQKDEQPQRESKVLKPGYNKPNRDEGELTPEEMSW